MRRSLLRFLILLVFAGSPPSPGQEPSIVSQTSSPANPTYDPDSFATELHRISDALKRKPSKNEMVALRSSLPRRWTISSQEGSFSISSEPLRDQLTTASGENAEAWVNHLADEIEYSAKPATGSPQARDDLERILKRPEFEAVGPPSPWELFRARVEAWIQRMLLKLFGGIARYPLGGQILFWFLVAATVGVVAMWVFRFFASRDRVNVLPPSVAVTAVRTWQEWIRAAREAAKEGNFREAVHSAYWAGISRLEDLGAVPKDRTKTPREYLRIMAEPGSGRLAPSPAHREPLAALTMRLERAWYANRGAGPADFRESLSHLEALGCSLE